MPNLVDVALLLLTSTPIVLAIVHFYLRLVKPEIAEAPDIPADWFRLIDRAASLAAWSVSGFCLFKGLDAWFWWLPTSEYKMSVLIIISMFASLFLLLGIGRVGTRLRAQARHDFLSRTAE
ncbi:MULTISPECIES: hypothetical protein [unclassified Bradyrhizobium]|uniref:hypothetical protein n=1 Tax=unclassified Bradyrhizobium TaxID=2631580 RepID=UPI0023035998|nr:hypothetical protein [Bradyrhizobium sp. CCBAU 45321]MDA9546509.1 hypothetical protein [Bradyrhizobium sp. CCBAU 45321]